MSCLWASPSGSVPRHISSLSHARSRADADPRAPPSDTQGEKLGSFVCFKAFLQRSLIYNKWHLHLRRPSLVGSYFSLIDMNYYIGMITMEPLPGWLHSLFK